MVSPTRVGVVVVLKVITNTCRWQSVTEYQCISPLLSFPQLEMVDAVRVGGSYDPTRLCADNLSLGSLSASRLLLYYTTVCWTAAIITSISEYRVNDGVHHLVDATSSRHKRSLP